MNSPFPWLVAAVALLAACALAVALFRRRTCEELVRQILRLAAEIEAVAHTIEADLLQVPEQAFSTFTRACADYMRRSGKVLADMESLQERQRVVLTSTLLLLHEDHRRIVDLRSDLDRALAGWAKKKAAGAPKPDVVPRIYRFESTIGSHWPRSSGSRWPRSGESGWHGSGVPRPSGFV